MARSNTATVAETDTDTDSDTVVSLASVLSPRAGDTIAEQFAHLKEYGLGRSGERYPNLLAPIQVRVGDIVDEYIAAVANSQYTARARNAAKDEPSIEAAFAKACAWRPSQTEWTALDELSDRFVILLIESSGLKTTGTREDREKHRNVLLNESAAALKYGAEFAAFVSDAVTADNGPPAAQPAKPPKPGKSGFSLL